MRVLLLALLCLVAYTHAAKGVFKGNDKNFDKDVIGSGKNAFVKFLAPW